MSAKSPAIAGRATSLADIHLLIVAVTLTTRPADK
jgi:hypothetical protein